LKRQHYQFGNFTDVGKIRTENQDYFGYYATPIGELFLVCDGMGGYEGGEVASRMAVETISDCVKSSKLNDPVQALGRAFEEANQKIREFAHEQPELRGMGSTCVALLIQYGKKPQAWRAHVGDSRIYRIRKGKIEQLTRDHSRVMEMVERGLLTKAEAESHPDRNIITRALGAHDTVQPDVEAVSVCRGDRFILCTDGISGKMSDEEILAKSVRQSPQRLAEMLVHLANERGGEDNSTIQVVDNMVGPRPPREYAAARKTWHAMRSQPRWLWIVFASAVLTVLLVFTYDNLFSKVKTENDVTHSKQAVESKDTSATDTSNKKTKPPEEEVDSSNFGVIPHHRGKASKVVEQEQREP